MRYIDFKCSERNTNIKCLLHTGKVKRALPARANKTMSEHTKTDGLPGMDSPELPQVLEKARPRSERMSGEKIECNACPVLCQISDGRSGACDRYANRAGTLVRVDPVLLLRRSLADGETALVPF